MRAACREAGLAWRERKLDPVTTVRSFLMQILYGNVACNQVPHPAEQDVTGAGYCAARSRLPVAALQALLTGATTAMTECVRETGRWLGHRLFVVDGSPFSMPDTEQLREHFGQSGQQAAGCGFPTAHFPALLHLGSGLLQKLALGPLRTHDLAQVPEVHPESEPGDVLLGDRGSFRGTFGPWGRGRVSDAPEDDRRFRARSIACSSQPRPGGAEVGPAAVAMAAAVGRPRSVGRMVQADPVSDVAVGGGPRRAARVASRARTAVRRRAARLSRASVR